MKDLGTTSGPMRWTSDARSHPGLVRKINEDAFLSQPERGLWAVADGMGGHARGEFASRLAIESLLDLPSPDDLEDFIELVSARLSSVNRRLRAEAGARGLSIIGTTIAVLLSFGCRCACLWSGDSRIYLHRAGRLRQLTRDHSEFEAARDRRRSSTDDTLHRPPAHLITRALGATDSLEVDHALVDVIDDDLFLLCSDGLSNAVSGLTIEQALLPGDCRRASRTLLQLALQRGGHDNITVVVTRAEDLDSPDRTAFLTVL